MKICLFGDNFRQDLSIGSFGNAKKTGLLCYRHSKQADLGYSPKIDFELVV